MPGRLDPLDAPLGERVRLYLLFAAILIAYYGSCLLLGLRPEGQLVSTWPGSMVIAATLGVGYASAILLRTLFQMPPTWGELRARLRERLLGPVFLERVAGIVLFTVGILVMYDIYGAFKPAMPRFSPYVLDPPLAEVDRLLHFGRDPWLWLHAVPGRDFVTASLDWIYVLWFEIKAVVLIGVMLFVPLGARVRFFIGYVLVWVVGGTLLGTLLASGGPVFYEGFTGNADRFSSLLGYLDGTAPAARNLQTSLWTAFTDPDSGMMFAGISAMPSLHVAVVAYYLYWALRTGPRLAAAAALYALLVFLGSVHLGWHYAVDGYAGMAIGLGAGWVAERVFASRVGRRGAGATPHADSRPAAGILP